MREAREARAPPVVDSIAEPHRRSKNEDRLHRRPRAALVLATCRARFTYPGVAPRTFRYGDKVELKVNKLTSVHTQIPYDYYSVKFCRPRGGIKQATENLGEFLSGDLIENSPYHLFMEQDQFCKVLCQVDLRSRMLRP